MTNFLSAVKVLYDNHPVKNRGHAYRLIKEADIEVDSKMFNSIVTYYEFRRQIFLGHSKWTKKRLSNLPVKKQAELMSQAEVRFFLYNTERLDELFWLLWERFKREKAWWGRLTKDDFRHYYNSHIRIASNTDASPYQINIPLEEPKMKEMQSNDIPDDTDDDTDGFGLDDYPDVDVKELRTNYVRGTLKIAIWTIGHMIEKDKLNAFQIRQVCKGVGKALEGIEVEEARCVVESIQQTLIDHQDGNPLPF